MVYQRIIYFLKAAEEGSFSKAAKQMYISSQALTKQIHLLEEELGGALFDRTPKGVVLTPLGQSAYQSFCKINQDLNVTVDTLKQQANQTKPQLNIGIFSSLPNEELVTPVVSFLFSRFKDYQVQINLVELNEGKRMIINRELDLLLTNYHEEDFFPDCKCYCIEKHKNKVVVSLYHPWAVKNSITIEDMKQETFLKMQMDSDHYRVPTENGFYNNIPCKKIEPISNFGTLFALLQQGNAFAVFPKAYAYMERAKMKYFDVPTRDFYFFTGLIYNPLTSNNKLESVVSEIVDEYNMSVVSFDSDATA